MIYRNYINNYLNNNLYIVKKIEGEFPLLLTRTEAVHVFIPVTIPISIKRAVLLRLHKVVMQSCTFVCFLTNMRFPVIEKICNIFNTGITSPRKPAIHQEIFNFLQGLSHKRMRTKGDTYLVPSGLDGQGDFVLPLGKCILKQSGQCAYSLSSSKHNQISLSEFGLYWLPFLWSNYTIKKDECQHVF